MIEPDQVLAGWPLALSLAAVTAQAVWAGRRRSALNEALHELRRPLQAVALAIGPAPADGSRDAVELASTAMERLDREINGGPPVSAWGPVDVAALADSAVSRWWERARLAGSALSLRWNAGPAWVRGDRFALGQALDNLILNAIEHGGPTIVVTARRREGRLRIAVVDSGAAARPPRRRGRASALDRLTGRRRHGHGLAVVRRVAAEHGGRFALRHSEHGALAAIELPLSDPEGPRAA